MLGSSAITVSVPRRTVIYATSAPAGTPEFEQFSAVTWATWLDDSHGNAPITTMLFRFEGADIVGASVLDPQPPPSPRRRGLFRRNR
ncbi:hypothetical protein [Gordonia crocea]|uniref:Uncharacterized protein n=1 Tax=Gordonia crocea TaxID=589162 RepID=A0A7M3SVD5_9ACTN|nr:hypothetical protein [Gordonia crocea]GED96609.1 hypothetical protein nbrc107697_06480 [Gordonia crocea]